MAKPSTRTGNSSLGSGNNATAPDAGSVVLKTPGKNAIPNKESSSATSANAPGTRAGSGSGARSGGQVVKQPGRGPVGKSAYR